jgi:hypothetical protein
MIFFTRCPSTDRRRSAFLAAIPFLLMAVPALAAEIVPVKGAILANAGSGFHPVDSRMKLNEGDAVLAGPGAQGSLVYADGCTREVVPGAVVWVEPKPPCSEGGASAAALPPLSPAKTFKRDWLVGGAALLKRTTTPVAP